MKNFIISTTALALAAGFATASSPSATAGGHQCQGLVATHVGTSGDDMISGTEGDDVIVGYGGHDQILAYGGDDVVCAGTGDDHIYGYDGDDRLYGEAGDDVIFGYAGHDLIWGGSGADILSGNSDSDTIKGGSGYDYINGGTGGTGPGDHCRDRNGAVIGADFYECETYDTYLFAGTLANLPKLTWGG